MRIALFGAFLLILFAPVYGAPGEARDNATPEFPAAFSDEFEEEFAETEELDPLRGYNRVMTDVNDYLYTSVLFPVARGYERIIPEGGRRAMSRFYSNLRFPVNFVNNLLQFKLGNSAIELSRFVVNSTVGIFGLYDPASTRLGLDPYPEDFGQTLGHYGVGGGFHIVLPFLGPSNLRDTLTLPANWYIDPITYIENRPLNLTDDLFSAYLLYTNRVLNDATFEYEEYESVKRDAVDLYPFFKSIYEQSRERAIAQ